MKRTTEFEKKQIPEMVMPTNNRPQNNTVVEDDDNDFEYYPVD